MDIKSILQWFLGHLLYDLVASIVGVSVLTQFLKHVLGDKLKGLGWKFYTLSIIAGTFFLYALKLGFQPLEGKPDFEVCLANEMLGVETNPPRSTLIIQLQIFNHGEDSITRNWGLTIKGADGDAFSANFLKIAFGGGYEISSNNNITNATTWYVQNDLAAKTCTHKITKNSMEDGQVIFIIPPEKANNTNFFTSHETEYTLWLADAVGRVYSAPFRWPPVAKK